STLKSPSYTKSVSWQHYRANGITNEWSGNKYTKQRTHGVDTE
ncbi:IS1 encoded protein, partial [Shigella flexneri]